MRYSLPYCLKNEALIYTHACTSLLTTSQPKVRVQTHQQLLQAAIPTLLQLSKEEGWRAPLQAFLCSVSPQFSTTATLHPSESIRNPWVPTAAHPSPAKSIHPSCLWLPLPSLTPGKVSLVVSESCKALLDPHYLAGLTKSNNQ